MTVRNLNRLFQPQSIVLIGASRREGSVGALVARNCVVWDNDPAEIVEEPGASVAVSYSNVQGGYPGFANAAMTTNISGRWH